jgi:pimeloyl-ACP methyl ester carboxylesterase
MGPVERSILAELAPAFRERTVSAAGGALRVIEGGEGPPLVLLHGRGGASTGWLPLLPGLARRHRVLAVDLPGFGASAGYRFAGVGAASARAFFADPVAAWLASEGVTAPAIIGHSLGGLVALDLALSGVAPSALVLLAAMGVGPEMTYPARLFFRAGPERLARLLGPRVLMRLLAPSSGPDGARLAALAGELLAVPGGRPDATVAFDTMVPITGPLPHLRARLPEIAAPTLVLWGERDEVFPAPLAIAASAALPRGVLRIVAGGHAPHLDDPVGALAILDDFLPPRA